MGVYIARDIEKLQLMLKDLVNSLWDNSSSENFQKLKLQYRFQFSVNQQKATLDIYQKDNGTTTFSAVGKNLKFSTKLKNVIESRSYPEVPDTKSYSMIIGTEWTNKTVEYLKFLCSEDTHGKYENFPSKESIRHVFISSIGDKLTLTEYSNGRVVVQGKPLFLYNEFLSFVSYSPKVKINDIIQATKGFGIASVSDVDEARKKLQELMPTAYSGSVDDTIWKIFSPAMVLIDFDKEMEDYSYCVFPALRALEGYLKFLLNEKGIIIDRKNNFSKVFYSDISDSNKKKICSQVLTKIDSAKYENALLEIYDYFSRNRNVIFHIDQIIIATKLIEDKTEAVSIVTEVAEIIERTYKNTHS